MIPPAPTAVEIAGEGWADRPAGADPQGLDADPDRGSTGGP